MPKPWVVYVLESLRDGKNYVGMTSSLPDRLPQHEDGRTKATRSRGPSKGEVSQHRRWPEVSQETYLLPPSESWVPRPNDRVISRTFVRSGGESRLPLFDSLRAGSQNDTS
jgi:hypothetical protein